MNHVRVVLLSICLVLGSWEVMFGQQLTRSPYSRYGIGDVLGASTTRNESMGGIGIASNNYFSVNRLNPAAYADLIFTTMDLSAFGQYSNLKNETSQEDEISAGFQNIFFGFPANNNMAFSFGFSPYSVVGYEINTEESIPYADTTQLAIINYIGDGGINQAYLGIAGKLLDQKLRLGANIAYSFGNTRYRTVSFTENDVPGNFSINMSEEVFVGGFSGQFGLIYQDTLSKPLNESSVLFRIGGTADYNFDLTGTREKVLNSQSGDAVITSDTLLNADGIISLPTKFGLGFNLSQFGKWSLGADVTYQNWDNFSYFDERPELDREFKVSLGGEWVPNIESFKYFPRIHFRAGLFYKSSYIRFNNEPIPDYGVSFGIGLPAAPKAIDRLNPGRTTSKINLSFTIGQRGALNDQLPLEEFYVRVRLGVTLNDSWFRRRVVD